MNETEKKETAVETTSAKQELLHNLAALVKVATIVTMVVITVFAFMALSGKLETDYVTTIVTMVVTFYFGSKAVSK